jgi:hypothetical protein
VDNNYLDLGMNKSGFVHTLPSGSLRGTSLVRTGSSSAGLRLGKGKLFPSSRATVADAELALDELVLRTVDGGKDAH